MTEQNDRIAEGARELVAKTATQLANAAARYEALASFEPARRVFIFNRAPAMVALGRVWRLGVFLLAADATLYATAATTRAVPPRHPGYQSVSAEERRGYRAAAHAGPFALGETVNFDAGAIALDAESLLTSAGPLFISGGRALVRWNASATEQTATPFVNYLGERVELLLQASAP